MKTVRSILTLTAMGLAILLGGCVVYPAYPGFGYGRPAPYYGGVYVGGGGGWHDGGGRDGGWRR